MLREAFFVDLPMGDQEQPMIIKVEITHPQGVSWRDAKKQLRQWYLGKAAGLRSITQKEYFSA